MPANPNWARWIFASIANAMKDVADDADLPLLVEHLQERTKGFMEAADHAELRISGPFTQELSKGCFRLWVDANVLLTSRYEGKAKNAYDILRFAGLFHEAMDSPIGVWNFGNQPGDYVDGDTSTQVFLGCLLPKAGNGNSVRVINFGQIDNTEKIKQTVVDVSYEMFLNE